MKQNIAACAQLFLALASAETLRGNLVDASSQTPSATTLQSQTPILIAQCPPNSTGLSPQAGCVCVAGYSGTILSRTAAPYYSGSCAFVNCPANTSQLDPAGNCACKAGMFGLITRTTVPPFFAGTCTPAACPAGSADLTEDNNPNSHLGVTGGCRCNAGFSGVIVPSTASPYYTGACRPVGCPDLSRGHAVADVNGCTCIPGYSGTIQATQDFPFFTGTCQAAPCPTNSTGRTIVAGCTCNPGYSGMIKPKIDTPYYVGACLPIPNPQTPLIAAAQSESKLMRGSTQQ